MLTCGLCGEWWVGEGYMCLHVESTFQQVSVNTLAIQL